MDIKLKFSSGYHPQTDGQIERTNQILEDMLRACALQYGTIWDNSLLIQSSLIITVTRKVSKCHLLRNYMIRSVEHHCFGIK